jgi:hypothetical protein
VTDGAPSKSNWIVSGVDWPSPDRGHRAPSSQPLIVLAGRRPWPVPPTISCRRPIVRRSPVVVAGTHEGEHPLFRLGETSERDRLTCLPDGHVEVRLEEPETVEVTRSYSNSALSS